MGLEYLPKRILSEEEANFDSTRKSRGDGDPTTTKEYENGSTSRI